MEVPQHTVPKGVNQHGELALRPLERIRIRSRLPAPVAAQTGIPAGEAASAIAALSQCQSTSYSGRNSYSHFLRYGWCGNTSAHCGKGMKFMYTSDGISAD